MMGQIGKTATAKDDPRNKAIKTSLGFYSFFLVFFFFAKLRYMVLRLFFFFFAFFLSFPIWWQFRRTLFVSGAGQLGCTGCRGQEISGNQQNRASQHLGQRQFFFFHFHLSVCPQFCYFSRQKKRPRNVFFFWCIYPLIFLV